MKLKIFAVVVSLMFCEVAAAQSDTSVQTVGDNIRFSLSETDTFKMIYVEGGTFTMGATPEQVDALATEEPTHSVTLSAYYIAEFEVTQKLWEAVMGTTIEQLQAVSQYNYGLCGISPLHPMYYISYNDCKEFMERLNSLLGDKLPQGFHFSLPTEAQWEYAARGGNRAKTTLYAGGNQITDVAWCAENSDSSTHTVGSKLPNELGIYDMSGNVYEWCSDWYTYYSSSSVTDPVNAYVGSGRAIRGGSWFDEASCCRVSARDTYDSGDRDRYGGMRIALVQ